MHAMLIEVLRFIYKNKRIAGGHPLLYGGRLKQPGG
jgi:hypothetical protein